MEKKLNNVFDVVFGMMRTSDQKLLERVDYLASWLLT